MSLAGARQAAVTLEALARTVAEHERRILELEQPRPQPYDDRAGAVLAAIATGARDLAFTSASLIETAAIDAGLRATLLAAGLETPWLLGLWLRSMRGRALAGLRLERLDRNNAGSVWIIRSDDAAAYSHPRACADGREGGE